MRAVVNIRHLENKPVVLQNELTVEELDIDPMDELIHLRQPLTYDLEVQKMDRGILARGTLNVVLECECARCLKTYPHPVVIDNWACHLPLSGEDSVPVINDLVDLTPYIREDIVLAFPQRPLCEAECKGFACPDGDTAERGTRESESTSSAWAELNKLKL